MMKKAKIIKLFFVSLLALIACIASCDRQEKNVSDVSKYDVSKYIEHLGIPYANRYQTDDLIYARNPWDLQAYNGKLYIGAGNSSNNQPAANAGSVPIISWNPKLNKFEEEFVVDEEQINTFYVFNQELYIPGHDSTESWQYGNFYKLKSGGKWQKYRNISNAIHVYSLFVHKNFLFAGLGVSTNNKKNKSIAAVSISRDWGVTWENFDINGFRIYNFLKANEKLYATDMFLGEDHENFLQKKNNFQYTPVYEFNLETGFSERSDLSDEIIFPGFKLEGFDRLFKIAKSQYWHSGTLYIGGEVHNDHHFIPFGLFYANNLELDNITVRRLKIYNGAKVWDFIIRNDVLYVLLEKKVDNNSIEISVLATKDMQNWQSVLSFYSTTFARSFEILNDDFYFGLGSEIEDILNWNKEDISSVTGEIIRVKKDFFNLSLWN